MFRGAQTGCEGPKTGSVELKGAQNRLWELQVWQGDQDRQWGPESGFKGPL